MKCFRLRTRGVPGDVDFITDEFDWGSDWFV